MTFGSFVTGLVNGVGQTDGLARLSQTAAQALGHYNPWTDPLFWKDMQMYGQGGSSAKNQFVDKYDDYMRFQIPAGASAPVKLSPDQKWEQMTGSTFQPKSYDFSAYNVMAMLDPEGAGAGKYDGFKNNYIGQQYFDKVAGTLGTLEPERQLAFAKANNETAQAGYWDQYAGVRGAEASQANALTPFLVNTENAQANQYNSHANLYNQQAMSEAALRDPRVNYEIARKALLDAQSESEKSILPLLLDKYTAEINSTNALADQRKQAVNQGNAEYQSQSVDGESTNEGFNLWKWAFPMNNTGWFSQSSAGREGGSGVDVISGAAPVITDTSDNGSSGQPQQLQKHKYKPADIVSVLKKQFGISSDFLLAKALGDLSEEKKAMFSETYGIGVDELVKFLNLHPMSQRYLNY